MVAVHFTPSVMIDRPSSHILATGGLAGAVVFGTLMMLVLAIVGSVIDRSVQAKAAFTSQLTTQTLELARQVEESRRLAARLEQMNGELHRSLADAYRSRRALSEEHEKNLELQHAAQLEAIKARWLEGIAETATAVARDQQSTHGIDNPRRDAARWHVRSGLGRDRRDPARRAANRPRSPRARACRHAAIRHYLGKNRMLDVWSKE